MQHKSAKVTFDKGASGIGYGLVIGFISVVALGAIGDAGRTVNDLFVDVGDDMGAVVAGEDLALPAPSASASASASPSPLAYASCDEIYQAESPPNGYTLRTINPSGSDDFNALCYFTDSAWSGGGFTVIAAQWQNDPISWAEGRQPDYTADLLGNPGNSFALTGSDIPSHSHILFGRIGSGFNDNIDLLPYTYTTGEILKTELVSPITGNHYHIARAPAGVYSSHDPENTLLTDPVHVPWYNTLTIDAYNTPSTSNDYTWSFSPDQTNPDLRSYAYRARLNAANITQYAWTIMVR